MKSLVSLSKSTSKRDSTPPAPAPGDDPMPPNDLHPSAGTLRHRDNAPAAAKPPEEHDYGSLAVHADPAQCELHKAFEEHHAESQWEHIKHLFENHMTGGMLRKFLLVDYDGVPSWLRDNEDIRGSYRVHFSLEMCARSLFQIHNETGNIWSHLLGFVLFVGILLVDLQPALGDNADFGDHVVFGVFLVGLKCCLAFSFVFHWFYCHSPETHRSLAALDYSGISLLIAGSYFPPVYYGFYCRPQWQYAYLGCIATVGCIITYVSLDKKYSRTAYRTYRAALYAFFGGLGILPFSHFALYPDADAPFPARNFLLMGSLYLIGAVIYAKRIPEVYWPGRFDVLGHSHQIFHCLVVAGAYVHYLACVEAYHWNEGRVCPPPAGG